MWSRLARCWRREVVDGLGMLPVSHQIAGSVSARQGTLTFFGPLLSSPDQSRIPVGAARNHRPPADGSFPNRPRRPDSPAATDGGPSSIRGMDRAFDASTR